MFHFFTITAQNYLSMALTLSESVLRVHPESSFIIFVADDANVIEHAKGIRIVGLKRAVSVDETHAFKYNVTEYCTSVKPKLFRYMLGMIPAGELVVYLDPDMMIFSRLDPIFENKEKKNLFLTPHLLYPPERVDDPPYPEDRHLWEGVFNLGFCAIRNNSDARKIINWWDDRLSEYCYSDHFDGLHTDQKWMDYAPVYFSAQLEVISSPAVNVAHWNLNERSLKEKDGFYSVNNERLIIFHFSGFDFDSGRLTRHSLPSKEFERTDVRRLVQLYRDAVLQNGHLQNRKKPYGYGQYSNGRSIYSLHRRLYRALGANERDPFDRESEFYKALESSGLIGPEGSADSLHSLTNTPNVELKIRIARVLLRFARLVLGVGNYIRLIKALNYFGRPENHLFLLGRLGKVDGNE